MKRILVTGSAGFIGSQLVKRLLESESNAHVIGLDSVNDYYDVNLKYARLEILGRHNAYCFIKGNMADKNLLKNL